MNNLRFSVNTISLDEWYDSVPIEGRSEPRSEVLVLTTDSSTELLIESQNLYQHVVVVSADFNDGRFFSIGRQIRLFGYSGCLTLVGDLLPDQYAALRTCGFDDVLVLEDPAAAGLIELDRAVSLAGLGGAKTSTALNDIATGSNP